MSSGAYDVLSEHQHIRRMVDMLEALLERRDQARSSWLPELTPMLAELAAGLGPHFRGEEAELFVDIANRLPRQVPTVDRLIEQHRCLTADFDEAAEQAKSLAESQAAPVEEFVARLASALRLLRSHEEQENELMLVAYWQDLGEAD
jgi:hemerythrin-like domain-containing protein